MNVFVSGGSQGIGKAVVERFCSSNGNIIHYTYNSHVDAALKIKEFISESGNRPISMHLDVTNREEIKKIKNTVEGKIDCLVNCFGILRDRTLKNMTDEELDLVIDVNLKGMLLTTRALLPYLNDGGCIINMTSMIGILGNFSQTSYAASKAGVIAFSKSLAKELAKNRIRVVTVAPSLVDTAIFKNLTLEQKEKLINRTLIGRMATPIEIADLIYFVATKGTYFNGDCIEVSGGFT